MHNLRYPAPIPLTLAPTRLTMKELLPVEHPDAEAKKSAPQDAKSKIIGDKVVFGKWIFAHEVDEKGKNANLLNSQKFLIHLDKSKPAIVPLGKHALVVNQGPDYTMWFAEGITGGLLFSQHQLIREGEEYKVVPTSAVPFSIHGNISFSRNGNAAIVRKKRNNLFQYLRYTQSGAEIKLPDKNRQQEILNDNYRFIRDSHLFAFTPKKKTYAIFSFDMDGLKAEGEIRFPMEWTLCTDFSCSPNGKNWYFLSTGGELFVFTVNDDLEIVVTCAIENVCSVQWVGNSLLVKVILMGENASDEIKYNVIFFPDPLKNESLLILTTDQVKAEKVDEECDFLSGSVEGNVAICGKENAIIFPLSTLRPEHQENQVRWLGLRDVLQENTAKTYVPQPVVKVIDEYAMVAVENNDPTLVTKACVAFQLKAYAEDYFNGTVRPQNGIAADQKLFPPASRGISEVEFNFILDLKTNISEGAISKELIDKLFEEHKKFGVTRKNLSLEAAHIVDNLERIAEKQQPQLKTEAPKKLGFN